VLARAATADGQAAVELLGLLPIVAGVALAAFCGLASARASEHAGHAAHAGAVALLEDEDPADAARAAAPDVDRNDLAVRIDGRRVTVTVRPRIPLDGLAGRLSATATADAGEEAAP
jgi:hypothetical protein